MNVSANNRRIAKNTLVLYFRQILIMLVGLYTVRVVLAQLGAEDYGIYNAVGGFVAMFSIISGSITSAISRFITIEIGRGNTERTQEIFSTSVLLLLGLALVVCAALETAGVWFLNSKMVIPQERIAAANWVFQFSMLAFILNLLSIPYNAMLIAHERMSVFAWISILEAGLKLAVAFALSLLSFDKLALYAALITLTALIVRMVYGVYCGRHFPEAKFKFIFDKKLVREMASFTGWAFWGNGIVILKDQGGNVLLNLFCGPVVNAARGIAMLVNNVAYSFVSNFMTASTPQITKNFAAGDLNSMHTLIFRSQKFGFFILLAMLLPICAGIDFVLNLWLVEVPGHTANFVVLVLLYSLAECFATPLVTGVLAQGNIKSYEIALSLIYSANFFASYLCLKFGMLPETVFVLNIVFKCLVVCALLFHSRKKYALSARVFLRRSFLPCALVFFICAAFTFFLPGKSLQGILPFMLRSLAIVAFTCLVEFFVGMQKNERIALLNIVKEKIPACARNKNKSK